MQTAPAPRSYAGRTLDRVAFPLGGIGAGSVCLEGNGGLTAWSLRNLPSVFVDMPFLAALSVDGAPARVLQGPVPRWKAHHPWGTGFQGTGGGQENRDFGYRRYRGATFTGRFPFATVELEQPGSPVAVRLEAWSPFVPGDADSSSLPVAALAYTVRNTGAEPVTAEFAVHMRNLFDPFGHHSRVEDRADGFAIRHEPADEPWRRLALRVACDDTATVDADWPEAEGQGWMLNRAVPTRWLAHQPRERRVHPRGASPGASLFAPFTLAPGEARTLTVRLSWYAPDSDQRAGLPAGPTPGDRFRAGAHRPWYAGRFASVDAVADAWKERFATLRARTAAFADALWSSTIPEPMLDGIAANLAILRTPTVLRQTDGRMWAWEGSHDDMGSCHGTCTHVWNYAQAVAHLFPQLERGLRETELRLCQDERGHQNFRAVLPLAANDHQWHAALDGQFGGLMKLHREWRIGGDDAWLAGLWPLAERSFAWMTATWDGDGDGVIDAPHHNTFDIEFHGRDPMAQSFYIGGCAAMAAMAAGLGHDPAPYRAREAKAAAALATMTAHGWFVQRVPEGATFTPVPGHNDERLLKHHRLADIVRREGPAYQFREGVMTECTTGLWLAEHCGLAPQQPVAEVRAHLAALVEHNLKDDLSDHDNSQRPAYAFGDDGGLVICTWPAGGEPTVPFPYTDEVFTGFEYAVACQLIRHGRRDDALRMVRLARARHDGERRNPFNEQECGHWYARALASYGLFQAWTGARYDKRSRTLHLSPVEAGDFTVFLAWDGGFGTAGLRDGQPFCTPAEGTIDIARFAVQSGA